MGVVQTGHVAHYQQLTSNHRCQRPALRHEDAFSLKQQNGGEFVKNEGLITYYTV
ncbi:hypothetical protein C0J52_02141 [Blattella germanica]|nr:hypothetical protein C0J52_02141 [Blattella germanica]